MNVTPPTAWATVQRMQRDGLVELDDKKVIHLTEHGRDLAMNIARRHRLAERFLTDVLKLGWAEAHREAHHFDELVRHLRAVDAERITIWCSAASTGEEPYSIAIAACEAFETTTPPVRILATDIDTNVLRTAAAGVYPVERIAAVSEQRRRAYFQRGSGPHAEMCRIRPALQSLVSFRQLNLLDADYGLRGGFQAVFCRNVMIYFDKPTQYAVLGRMAPLLAPGGLLFAGHSESFAHAQDLVVPCGRTIYRAAPGAGARR